MKTEKILGKMAERRVTQRDLARALSLSLGSVNKKLHGKSPVNTDEAKEICIALGIVDNAEKVDIFLS